MTVDCHSESFVASEGLEQGNVKEQGDGSRGESQHEREEKTLRVPWCEYVTRCLCSILNAKVLENVAVGAVKSRGLHPHE